MLSDKFIQTLYHDLIEFHIFCGCLCIILFWISIWKSKGTFFHILNGRLYLIAGFGLLAPGMIADFLTIMRPEVTHPKTDPYLSVNLSLFTIFLGITVFSNMVLGQQFIRHKNNLKRAFNSITISLHFLIFLIGSLMVFGAVLDKNYILFFNGLLVGLAFPISFYKSYTKITTGMFSTKTYVWLHLRAIFHSALAIHIAFLLTGFMRRFAPHVYEQTGLLLLCTPLPLALLLDFILVKKIKPIFDPVLDGA